MSPALPWREHQEPRLLSDEQITSGAAHGLEVAYFGEDGASTVLTYDRVDDVEPFVCSPTGQVLTMTPPGAQVDDLGEGVRCEIRGLWTARGWLPTRMSAHYPLLQQPA